MSSRDNQIIKGKGNYFWLDFGILVYDEWVELLWAFGEQGIVVEAHDGVNPLKFISCKANRRKKLRTHNSPKPSPNDLKTLC